MPDKVKYPECEKMLEIREESQSIGQFLDWLQSDRRVILSEYCADVECQFCEESEERLMSVKLNMETLLAEYFNVDLEKVEKEKLTMLEKLKK